MLIKEGKKCLTSEITEDKKQAIIIFLQGAVYCWCNVNGENEFSLRDLMGGENRNWEGTPLQELYNVRINSGEDEDKAYKDTRMEAGNLLQEVLIKDNRCFVSDAKDKGDAPRKYRWKKD